MSAPPLTLAELATILQGRLASVVADRPVTGLQYDSRILKPGEVFFAIQSPTGDGHDYLAQAAAAGAAAAVVSRPAESAAGCPLVVVDDTRAALLRFAAWKTGRWPGTIVGITGSSGKTTTKEFTAEILSRRFRVFRTPGNYNNTLGLPVALFQLNRDFEVAVLEMGMSTPGELAALCAAIPPRVAVLANIGSVHLQNFPDREALARAKAEIIQGMHSDGTLVYNLDDPQVRRVARESPRRSLSYGMTPGADLRILDWRITPDRHTLAHLEWDGTRCQVELPLLGGHYLYNLAAAAAVGLTLGLTLEHILAGTARLHPFKMRGEIRRLPNGVLLLDDSYNSNPEAMQSLLDTFGRWPDRPPTVIVAGEMRELGPESARLHAEVGAAAARLGCALLIGVQGDAAHLVDAARAAGAKACFCPDVPAALETLRPVLRPGQLLLVKGSRGVGLDRLVQALETPPASPEENAP